MSGVKAKVSQAYASQKNEMHRLYWEEEESLDEVAKIIGCSGCTVRRYIGKGRAISECNNLRFKKKQYPGKVETRYASNGYKLVLRPAHQRAHNGNGSEGYVYEHIVVWEEFHQKTLPKGWQIHHINGIKDDNSPDNLIAVPQGKHRDIIPKMAMRIRQLEIENRQLKSALESGQMIFTIGEN